MILDTLDRQLGRIRRRVREGGHDVPAGKVGERRQRSFQQLAWFARAVDACYVFDNSVGEPELAGAMRDNYLIQIRPLPADLLAIVNAHGLETPRLNTPDSWQLLSGR